ncbi:MAG: hypothetical protein ACKPKO_23030, partial [Candidatus Fonsibacter sp.]
MDSNGNSELYVAGDWNIRFFETRNERGMGDATRLADAWARAGTKVVFPQGATRRSGGSKAMLDYIAVPCNRCLSVTLRIQWLDASDHASVSLCGKNQGQKDSKYRCTAVAMERLPREAFVDLRLRYRSLCYLFNVSTA